MNLPDYQVPVPANPPDAGTIIAVQFGQDWIPIILTVLEFLRQENFFLNPPSDILAQVDELLDRIANPMIISPQLFPPHNVILPQDVTILAGNARVWVSNVSQNTGGYWVQSPAALNDEFSFQVLLPSGSCKVRLHCIHQNQSGNFRLSTDEGRTYDNDFYSNTNVFNDNAVYTITIDTPGLHTLKFKCIGKNGASTGYALLWSAIDIGY